MKFIEWRKTNIGFKLGEKSIIKTRNENAFFSKGRKKKRKENVVKRNAQVNYSNVLHPFVKKKEKEERVLQFFISAPFFSYII